MEPSVMEYGFFIMGCEYWSIRTGLVHHKKGQSGKHCLSYSLTASFQIPQALTLFTTPRKCKALFNLPLALLRHVEVRALHIPDLMSVQFTLQPLATVGT